MKTKLQSIITGKYSVHVLLLMVIFLLLTLIKITRYSYFGTTWNRYVLQGVDRLTNKLVSCEMTQNSGIINSDIPLKCK